MEPVRSRLRCASHAAALRYANDPLINERRRARRAELAAAGNDRRRARRQALRQQVPLPPRSELIDPAMPSMDWADRSACRGMPAEMFYPAESMHVSPAVVELCAGCPVRGECYDHAMRYEVDGFWSGTTPNERKSRRRKLGMPKPTVRIVGLPYE
jgi:hypothetical protein